jgi:hypothetical protein
MAGHQHFRRPFCLYLQCEEVMWQNTTLEKVAARSSKMFVSYHVTTQNQNPENHDLNPSDMITLASGYRGKIGT